MIKFQIASHFNLQSIDWKMMPGFKVHMVQICFIVPFVDHSRENDAKMSR